MCQMASMREGEARGATDKNDNNIISKKDNTKLTLGEGSDHYICSTHYFAQITYV